MLCARPYRENTDHTLAALQHHLLDGIWDGVQLLDSVRIFFQESIWDSPVKNHVAHFFPDDFRIVAYTYCGGEKQAEKLRDLEFAVIGPDETPQELAQIIEEKKNDSFRLTYTSGNDLYIAAGYGKQETGGYSITVPELYLTDNSIIVKTELKGPERSEPTGEEPSYPYIVLRTELLEEPVVFQ